jgi:hypothetical protein
MPRNPELNKIGALFAAADNGHFSLPDVIVRQQRRVPALTEALRDRHGRQLPGARGALASDILDAIDADKALPDAATLIEAAVADQAAAEMRTVLSDLLQEAQDDLVTLVMHAADEIIVDHLRPALVETLDQAAQAADKIGNWPIVSEAALTAPQETREAIIGLGGLAGRYRAVRNAQRCLRIVTPGPRFDTDDVFVELRNLPDVWPNYSSWSSKTAPWPSDPRQRLLWLVTSDAEPWMPTPREQDRRLLERFPESPAAKAASGEGHALRIRGRADEMPEAG